MEEPISAEHTNTELKSKELQSLKKYTFGSVSDTQFRKVNESKKQRKLQFMREDFQNVKK